MNKKERKQHRKRVLKFTDGLGDRYPFVRASMTKGIDSPLITVDRIREIFGK